MKAVRLFIIFLSIACIAGTIAFTLLMPALSAAGPRSTQRSAVLMTTMLFSFPTLLLYILSIYYVRRLKLSKGWLFGILFLPGLASLLMALRNPPYPAYSVAPARAPGAASAPSRPAVQGETENKPISAAPRCAWKTGGRASALPGSSWKAVAEAFIAAELSNPAPNFPGLRAALALYPAEERHAAWHQVGWAFHRRGDVGTANLCFAEGLLADPDPASANWSNLQFLPLAGADAALAASLGRYPSPPTPDNRAAAAELAGLLAERLGVFIDSEEASTAEAYNRAVELFNSGEYKTAIAALEPVIQHHRLGFPAVYLRALCARKSGAAVVPPAGLEDKTDEIGSAYLACNVAARLIRMGARAAVSSRGSSSMVKAVFQGAQYSLSAASLAGSFLTMAWRKEGSRDIPLNDPGANPNPSRADQAVIELARLAPQAPPEKMPRGGLPDSL